MFTWWVSNKILWTCRAIWRPSYKIKLTRLCDLFGLCHHLQVADLLLISILCTSSGLFCHSSRSELSCTSVRWNIHLIFIRPFMFLTLPAMLLEGHGHQTLLTVAQRNTAWVISLGCYLDEWPVHALSQADGCIWTCDCLAPGQVPSPTDHLVKCHFRTNLRQLELAKDLEPFLWQSAY